MSAKCIAGEINIDIYTSKLLLLLVSFLKESSGIMYIITKHMKKIEKYNTCFLGPLPIRTNIMTIALCLFILLSQAFLWASKMVIKHFEMKTFN